eukprot:3623866-Prorocentrum_lima.AAC.1
MLWTSLPLLKARHEWGHCSLLHGMWWHYVQPWSFDVHKLMDYVHKKLHNACQRNVRTAESIFQAVGC